MVFEHLFPEALLERKHWTAFVLALIYSTISIVIARLLFPANSGIVSIIFVSIFLIPYFETLLKEDEDKEENDTRRGFVGSLLDTRDAFRTYLFIFLGIYVAYMMYCFLSPLLGYDVSRVFREQLSPEIMRGGATFSSEMFTNILLNNWWVLLACFVVALVAGDGAIFFVAWNASTWGTIFGYRAMMAGSHDGTSALVSLLIIVAITLPHVLLEGSAYILAAISGGVMSDLVDSAEEVRNFVVYFVASMICFILAYFVLRSVFASSSSLLVGSLAVVAVLLLLHAMQFVFQNTRDQLVFRYNYYLFLLALGVFVIGALVETFVLNNSSTLAQVYALARY